MVFVWMQVIQTFILTKMNYLFVFLFNLGSIRCISFETNIKLRRHFKTAMLCNTHRILMCIVYYSLITAYGDNIIRKFYAWTLVICSNLIYIVLINQIVAIIKQD